MCTHDVTPIKDHIGSTDDYMIQLGAGGNIVEKKDFKLRLQIQFPVPVWRHEFVPEKTLIRV
jgi:hypothetical protein